MVDALWELIVLREQTPFDARLPFQPAVRSSRPTLQLESLHAAAPLLFPPFDSRAIQALRRRRSPDVCKRLRADDHRQKLPAVVGAHSPETKRRSIGELDELSCGHAALIFQPCACAAATNIGFANSSPAVRAEF